MATTTTTSTTLAPSAHGVYGAPRTSSHAHARPPLQRRKHTHRLPPPHPPPTRTTGGAAAHLLSCSHRHLHSPSPRSTRVPAPPPHNRTRLREWRQKGRQRGLLRRVVAGLERAPVATPHGTVKWPPSRRRPQPRDSTPAHPPRPHRARAPTRGISAPRRSQPTVTRTPLTGPPQAAIQRTPEVGPTWAASTPAAPRPPPDGWARSPIP